MAAAGERPPDGPASQPIGCRCPRPRRLGEVGFWERGIAGTGRSAASIDDDPQSCSENRDACGTKTLGARDQAGRPRPLQSRLGPSRPWYAKVVVVAAYTFSAIDLIPDSAEELYDSFGSEQATIIPERSHETRRSTNFGS